MTNCNKRLTAVLGNKYFSPKYQLVCFLVLVDILLKLNDHKHYRLITDYFSNCAFMASSEHDAGLHSVASVVQEFLSMSAACSCAVITGCEKHVEQACQKHVQQETRLNTGQGNVWMCRSSYRPTVLWQCGGGHCPKTAAGHPAC